MLVYLRNAIISSWSHRGSGSTGSVLGGIGTPPVPSQLLCILYRADQGDRGARQGPSRLGSDNLNRTRKASREHQCSERGRYELAGQENMKGQPHHTLPSLSWWQHSLCAVLYDAQPRAASSSSSSLWQSQRAPGSRTLCLYFPLADGCACI